MSEQTIGASFEQQFPVESQHLASQVGSGSIDVLGTPTVIAWMEGTAAALVQPLLEEGCTTVGSQVHVEHLAPTVEGDMVTVRAALTAAEGRVYTFSLEAADSAGCIAKGTHQRVSVKSDRFLEKARQRRDAANG